MPKEVHPPSPEVSKVLEHLEKQPDKPAVRLDFSDAHRITSGDIIALANFMEQRPGLQEIQLKGHFYQVEYIHKTLYVLSRQNLRRLLLTFNTNKSLQPLVFTREATESLAMDFRAKIFPKLGTLGLYRTAFSSPEHVARCIIGLSGLELRSLHLSLLNQPKCVFTTETARMVGEALSQLKTLHKVALLDVVMGQIEATAFLNGLDQQGPHSALLSNLCLGIACPGSVSIDPSDLAVSFLAGVERRAGKNHSVLLETGVGVLLSFHGFKKISLHSVDELKRRVGALIVTLCSESVASNRPRTRHAIRSLMDYVVGCVNIRFEADGSMKELTERLTKNIRKAIEDVRQEVETELLKGLKADFGMGSATGGTGTGGGGEGTDSYGDSDRHGSKSRSGNTFGGGSSTRGRRKKRDKDDWVFGSFCSSSPISDDFEEDTDESDSFSNPQSDPTNIGSGKTGLGGGRPAFSSTGTFWEYNPSSLSLGSIFSYVAHCEQKGFVFEGTSSRSPKILTNENILRRRVELYEEIVEGEKDNLNEEEQVVLFEAVQPTIIDLYKKRSSMFCARCFSSLSEMAENISSFYRTEVGSIIPRSLSEKKEFVYVTLVN